MVLLLVFMDKSITVGVQLVLGLFGDVSKQIAIVCSLIIRARSIFISFDVTLVHQESQAL